ncbi:pentapeptide repeat-containing protein [Chlorobaculum thiosulfatiphilum]|uniref:Pentapeptide repeat-containing protein n=1 Tax=Chlorobaculum thiosulfatiphilum TaxID=115852 RepID=A0A5C4S6W1_CHLTI|nr:pentapeptide repeat-containing protein [Chlorobaculum thiosulfatiphilum]TNJ38992.1 pentapeptide repeat-containing protein [Chlorobaculum thiosulfatiphilum]
MANEEQLIILKQGTVSWNKWRNTNPDVKIDISGADLRGTDLSGIDLTDAYLSYADFTGANLSEAMLRGAYLATAKLERADFKSANLTSTNFWFAQLKKADLKNADLTNAKLSWANLKGADLKGATLSGAVIDSNTKLRGAKSITRGVNGIYSHGTKTAALMNMAPEGDSMQGSSVEAVLDNLKHARRLHSISLLFAGITLLSFVLHRDTITVPFNILKDPIDAVTFAGLSIIISATLMMFTSIFFGSALDGTKYLTSRDSAMKVGQFPWILSKYEKGIAPKIISILLRIILCFHPFIFIIVLSLQSTVADFERTPILLYLLFVSVPMLLVTCFWLFRLSLGFLRPIVFDVVEEAKRQSGDEKIASTIKEQTGKIDELLKFLQEREGGQRGDR